MDFFFVWMEVILL